MPIKQYLMEENGGIISENIVEGRGSYTMLYKPTLKSNIIKILLLQ